MTRLILIKRPKVERITSLSRSAIYAAMEAGDFPRPVRIGKRSVGVARGRHRNLVGEPPEGHTGRRPTLRTG